MSPTIYHCDILCTGLEVKAAQHYQPSVHSSNIASCEYNDRNYSETPLNEIPWIPKTNL